MRRCIVDIRAGPRFFTLPGDVAVRWRCRAPPMSAAGIALIFASPAAPASVRSVVSRLLSVADALKGRRQRCAEVIAGRAVGVASSTGTLRRRLPSPRIAEFAAYVWITPDLRLEVSDDGGAWRPAVGNCSSDNPPTPLFRLRSVLSVKGPLKKRRVYRMDTISRK